MKTLTQKEKILKLLTDDPAGINSFGIARDIALQLPTRISELKEKGYIITSIHQKDGSVDYVLTGKPQTERKRVGWEKVNETTFRPIYE